MYSDELQAVAKDSLFSIKMRQIRIMGPIAYTSSTDAEVPVLCKVVEDRYKVEDGYKIELESIDALYGKESFYISDLAALIRSGNVKRVTVVEHIQQKLNEDMLKKLVRVM